MFKERSGYQVELKTLLFLIKYMIMTSDGATS